MMKKRNVMILFSATVALTLAACGSKEQSSSTSSTSGTTKYASEVTHDGTPIKGGTLKYAIVSSSPFSGIFADELSSDTNDSSIGGLIDESMFDYDENRKLTNTGLASIEFDVENKTATVTLNSKDYKWSDGQPVTIDDYIFAYQAIEFVGITTSETANPRKVLPKAIKEIPIRIVIFYVGALIALMAIFPWQKLPVNESPFVTVFQMAGIKWAAAFINFVVLTAAASSLNSTLYSTGRHLFQIAKETPNSKVMKALKLDTLSRNGIPSRAIIVSAIVVCVSAFINVLPGVSDAFALITASSSGVYIAIYILTMLAHLKYRKSQEFMADGFLMPAYKILNPLTILFFIFVFVCLFLQKSTVVGAIGAAIWIVVFSIYSNWKHSK